MVLRLLLYILIFGAIYFGIRKILRDWKQRFADIDKATRERDLNERKRPGVVELKRDQDGVFRPGDKADSDKSDKQDKA